MGRPRSSSEDRRWAVVDSASHPGAEPTFAEWLTASAPRSSRPDPCNNDIAHDLLLDAIDNRKADRVVLIWPPLKHQALGRTINRGSLGGPE